MKNVIASEEGLHSLARKNITSISSDRPNPTFRHNPVQNPNPIIKPNKFFKKITKELIFFSVQILVSSNMAKSKLNEKP